MEAARDEKASAMSVASTNGTVKKIFRARKTMTASCRQQIAAFNKLKNPSKIETFKESPFLTKENVQQKQTTLVLSSENCITQNNTSSEMEKHQSQNPFPNEFNTSTEVLPEDSGLKMGCLEGKWEEWSKPCEMSASGVEMLVGSPANFSHIADNVNHATSNTKIAPFNDARLVSSQLEVVEREKSISDCDHLQDIKKDTLNTNMDNCSPGSKISESPSLRPVNEDCFLKMNSATGLVTSMDILDTDSTDAAIPNESNASCGTTGASDSVMPSFTMNVHIDSTPNNLFQGCNITSGECQKKRSFSGDSGVSEAKRAKTSNKSLLDEVGGLIQRRIQTVFKKSFDQRIQDLSQQINLIQCKEDNTEILTQHLRSIKRLGRRIKYALQVQNEVVIQSSKLPSVGSTCKELPKSKAAEEISTSQTEKNSMQNLPANSSHPVVLSDNETEQQSDHGQTEHQRNPSKKVDHSAIHKIMESIKEHRNKTQDKQPMAVIDLTDDEEQKADGDSTLDATYPSSSHITSSSAPVPEDEKNENLSQECSEKKEPPERNYNEYYDVTEKNSSGHKSVNIHDSLAYLDISQNPDPQMLKPPQKPELRLAQVQNPKGIALSWNITHADPSCAPAQVYCLYVHQENPNNSKKLWKKIGEIKALPLPMACTLTQFVDDATYSFVLRAKDACGRFGPLCDIQSTTLKSLNTTKKT